ncbi:MAG: hypothetical protein MK212_14260 [Saprospiraceae bacterium]|nr:hypothetical protein [Saprospiraceae bacterium]
MKKVHINISGRIPNYMFGLLRDNYYQECEKAIEYTSEEAETIADFVKMLYETTLDSSFEVFKANIDMAEFRANCPLLSEFIRAVEAGDASYVSDFHQSAPKYAGSHLFYDGELI